MPITTPLDETRLLLGDTDTDNVVLFDEELDWFLSENSDDPYLAAADACDALATRFARQYDFTTDQQSFSRSQMSKAYASRGKELRAGRVGVTSVVTTRVDGYSQDIDSESVSGSGANPRRKFSGSQDNPF